MNSSTSGNWKKHFFYGLMFCVPTRSQQLYSAENINSRCATCEKWCPNFEKYISRFLLNISTETLELLFNVVPLAIYLSVSFGIHRKMLNFLATF